MPLERNEAALERHHHSVQSLNDLFFNYILQSKPENRLQRKTHYEYIRILSQKTDYDAHDSIEHYRAWNVSTKKITTGISTQFFIG
jgi:hypothetical protein